MKKGILKSVLIVVLVLVAGTLFASANPRKIKEQKSKAEELLEIDKQISRLQIDDKNVFKETQEKLMQQGRRVLCRLEAHSKAKDRNMRFKVIHTYLRILLQEKMDPLNDEIILSALNDKYYKIRFYIIALIADGKGSSMSENLIMKFIRRPEKNDKKVYIEVIQEMRKKIQNPHKVFGPTFIEEGYLAMMGSKINKYLKSSLLDKQEHSRVKDKLLDVFILINPEEGLDFLLMLLEKTEDANFQISIINLFPGLTASSKKNKEKVSNFLENLNKRITNERVNTRIVQVIEELSLTKE